MKQTAEKIEKLVKFSVMDCERCYASKKSGHIIDTIRPWDGLTWYNGHTLEQIQAEDPDAEEMGVDEFCAWKAAQQRTPITWTPTTGERYDEMLGCLPPALMLRGGFLVGEPCDHDAGNGQPRFQAFRVRSLHDENIFEVASRPMTRTEFRAQIGGE